MIGEKVKLIFRDTGKMKHNLVIDELEVSTKTVGAGKEDTVIFTASKAGDFEFYCSVGNHRQLGMEGRVTIK